MLNKVLSQVQEIWPQIYKVAPFSDRMQTPLVCCARNCGSSFREKIHARKVAEKKSPACENYRKTAKFPASCSSARPGLEISFPVCRSSIISRSKSAWCIMMYNDVLRFIMMYCNVMMYMFRYMYFIHAWKPKVEVTLPFSSDRKDSAPHPSHPQHRQTPQPCENMARTDSDTATKPGGTNSTCLGPRLNLREFRP